MGVEIGTLENLDPGTYISGSQTFGIYKIITSGNLLTENGEYGKLVGCW